MSYVERRVCVIFADIVGWTRLDPAAQINTATGLFNDLVTLLKRFGLPKPLWKTSTGDGFGIAFPIEVDTQVVSMCADLHHRYASATTPSFRPPLRLAVASGSMVKFENILTNDDDWTGHALIKARRILDGITDGNIMLVDAALASDVRARLPEILKPFLISHTEIIDKHRETHHVAQMLSPTEHPLSIEVPATMSELVQRTRSIEIPKNLLAIDGLIILWMSSEPSGLEAGAVTLMRHRLSNIDPRTGLPNNLSHIIMPYWKAVKEDDKGDKNRRKVWIERYGAPLTDRPTLALTIGETNYLASSSLQRAFDDRNGIRSEYESGARDILSDLPNLAATCSVILTSDQHVILSQRKPKQVDVAGGDWSVSFEEQWAPDLDEAPHETVLRGLSEEFNVDPHHGVPLSIDNVWLLALAREWGTFWNTVMVYLVRVPVDAKKVLDCWSGMPPPIDKEEHVAVAAVPISSDVGRSFLLKLLDREASITKSDLLRVCGPDNIRGNPSPDTESHPPHSTSGRARILLALWTAGQLHG